MNRVGLVVTLLAYVVVTAALGWVTGRWSEAIYFLTGLILLWYTWETRLLRLAARRQTSCWREVHRLFHVERRSKSAIARRLALDRKTMRGRNAQHLLVKRQTREIAGRASS